MICRELKWRRRSDEDDVIWTAKTFVYRGYYFHNIDLSFTIESGKSYSTINRNALLIVRKKEPGKKIAKKVILTVEFKNSYLAKNVIDALLYLSKNLHEEQNAEQWFLEQLKNYKGAPMPEKSSTLYYDGRGYPI
jgi:hypothetical protein